MTELASITYPEVPATHHFDQVQAVLADEEFRKQMIAETATLAVFHITNKDGFTAKYVLDLKTEGTIVQGDEENPDVTIILTEENWSTLAEGKSGAKWMLVTGKLKYTGSIVSARLVDPALRKCQKQYKEKYGSK